MKATPRAFRFLDAAWQGKPVRGGRRPSAGRKAKRFGPHKFGAWNRGAVVNAMQSAMSVNPFGREAFAHVPGAAGPRAEIASMLVALMLRDRYQYGRIVEAIVAGGARKRAALLRLRRQERDADCRVGPGGTPTWRTCLTYYKRFVAAGGERDHNATRMAMHKTIPTD